MQFWNKAIDFILNQSACDKYISNVNILIQNEINRLVLFLQYVLLEFFPKMTELSVERKI